MTKSRIFLVIQAAVCVALAVWLSLAAVSVFREGSERRAENPMESIYTPEIVAEKTAPVMPLFIAGAALLIAGLVLGVKDGNAEKPVKDASFNRDILAEQIAQPSEAILRERSTQKKLLLSGRILFALCMVPVLVYLLNPAHFPQDDLEGMFRGLMRVFLPWTAAGLGALAVSRVLREKSIFRETRAAGEQLKKEKAKGHAAVLRPVDQPKKAGAAQAVIIAAAVICIIAGVLNGSARDVLYKAITICTECIGLG